MEDNNKIKTLTTEPIQIEDQETIHYWLCEIDDIYTITFYIKIDSKV